MAGFDVFLGQDFGMSRVGLLTAKDGWFERPSESVGFEAALLVPGTDTGPMTDTVSWTVHVTGGVE